jgi:hypothetical protein
MPNSCILIEFTKVRFTPPKVRSEDETKIVSYFLGRDFELLKDKEFELILFIAHDDLANVLIALETFAIQQFI